jgi:hypothetical protein
VSPGTTVVRASLPPSIAPAYLSVTVLPAA